MDGDFAELGEDELGLFPKLILGTFKRIEHTLYTGSAHSVKQWERRTPLGFAVEGEAQLTKMWEVRLIQFPTSEWAPAPVLIWKKDSTVWSCVDSPILNSMAVRDWSPQLRVEDCLDNHPVLALPRTGGEFILDTDASETAIGAEISFVPTWEKKWYCTTREQLLAVILFSRGSCHYLLGLPFDPGGGDGSRK
jgi:hypothetical protein